MAGKQKFDFENDEPMEEPVPEEVDEAPEHSSMEAMAAQSIAQDLFHPQEAAVEEVLDEAAQVDEQMSEVEAKLELARYYRMLLNGSLFTDVSSAPARQVEKEVRDFVRQRLAVLMGVQQEPVKKPKITDLFDGEEVETIKMLIAKVRAKAGTAPAAPREPAPEPSLQPKKVPAAPALAKKTPPPAQVNARPPPQQPAPQTEPEPAERPAPRQPAGKTNPLMVRVPKEHQDNKTLHFKGGRAYIQFVDPDTGPLWEFDPILKKTKAVVRDITLPARPPPNSRQPLPPLNDEQLNAHNSQHSGDMIADQERRMSNAPVYERDGTVRSRGNYAGSFAAAVVSSIKPQTEE